MFCVLFGLAACATQPTSLPPVADPDKAWQDRQERVGAIDTWSLAGRVAITSPEDSWNARLRWRQSGEDYTIRLSGPLGQGAAELSGNRDGVTLRTADKETYSAQDPEALLLQTLGWRLPLAGLRYWVLGVAEPQASLTSLDLNEWGRAQAFEQSGWQVRYMNYGPVDDLQMPTKLYLDTAQLSARLVVSRWDLGSG